MLGLSIHKAPNECGYQTFSNIKCRDYSSHDLLKSKFGSLAAFELQLPYLT